MSGNVVEGMEGPGGTKWHGGRVVAIDNVVEGTKGHGGTKWPSGRFVGVTKSPRRTKCHLWSSCCDQQWLLRGQRYPEKLSGPVGHFVGVNNDDVTKRCGETKYHGGLVIVNDNVVEEMEGPRRTKWSIS